jgi:hypothetical protein
MKQTAVEWLIETHFGSIENCTPDFRNKIQQAKEMEKQQIIDAYQNGSIDGQIYALTRKVNIENGEQYYNEQFKNK